MFLLIYAPVRSFFPKRYLSILSELFTTNHMRLAGLLPRKALALVNANAVPVTNADGTAPLRPRALGGKGLKG